MRFIQAHLATFVYLVGVGAAFFFLLHAQWSVHAAQVAACERGNVIRSQMNVLGSTMSSFLLVAADARDRTADEAEAAGQSVKARADRNTAKEYRALIPSLTPFPLTDCNRI